MKMTKLKNQSKGKIKVIAIKEIRINRIYKNLLQTTTKNSSMINPLQKKK